MSNSTVDNYIAPKAKCSIEVESDYSYPGDHWFDAMLEKAAEERCKTSETGHINENC